LRTAVSCSNMAQCHGYEIRKYKPYTVKYNPELCLNIFYLYFTILYNTSAMSQLNVIKASQGCIHKYEKLKRKLYSCNANIYFNRQCLHKQWIPNHLRITDLNTSPAYKYTQHKVPNIRIKDEIKYLYTKKQHLNQQICYLDLTLANSWLWSYIQHTVEGKLKKAIQFKYKNVDKNQTDKRTN
jgi:hypothetical protein